MSRFISFPLFHCFPIRARLAFMTAFFLVVCSFQASRAGNDEKKILLCGSILDVTSGAVVENQTIRITGNVITSVEAGYSTPEEGEEVIDLREHLVLPGLIDMHVHLEIEFSKTTYMDKLQLEKEDLSLRAYANAMKTLQAGFTTVRDLGGTGANSALRDAINQGIVKGPRIYSCGKSIAITGGHADPTNGIRRDLQGKPTYQDGVCDGAEDCAKAVRWQMKQGADCIKITATGGVLSVAEDGDGPAFSEEELRAIVETATDRGVHVAAHAHGKEGMLRAVEAGVLTIEHGSYMDDEVREAMKRKGAYMVPTITAGWQVAEDAEIEGFYPEVVREKARRIGPQILEAFREAYADGVNIAFGTDAGVFPHGQNAREFELMHKGGMPVMQALITATIVNARVLGWEQKIGSIEAGKLADIIAVDPDVLEDPGLLMSVPFVMKDGEVLVNEKLKIKN